MSENGTGDFSTWTTGPLYDHMVEETVDLMYRAQWAIARIEAETGPVLSADDRLWRLALLRECSRATAHLTAVMGWLLACRAAARDGAEPDAQDAHSLEAALVEVPEAVNGCPEATPIPPEFAQLVQEAEDLYARARRLQNGAGR